MSVERGKSVAHAVGAESQAFLEQLRHPNVRITIGRSEPLTLEEFKVLLVRMGFDTRAPYNPDPAAVVGLERKVAEACHGNSGLK